MVASKQSHSRSEQARSEQAYIVMHGCIACVMRGLWFALCLGTRALYLQ